MTIQDKFMEKYLCDVMNENEKFFNRKKTDTGIYIF